ncbi:MAG TPA: mannosyltransferase family protein [Vicinamibacterales bacterium]|nr:mannosyltransferase family protein [Vicinamibacterales bacterium]
MPGHSLRKTILQIVVAALAWRALTAVAAFLVNVVFPIGPTGELFTVRARTHFIWDTFARWDSGWYFTIARYGYEWVEGGRSNIAFFPLYPLLMRYLGLAFGGGRVNLFLAGIIISWASFVLAMVMLYRLAKVELGDDEERARHALVYAAVFPFAFFFGVVYTESLFLLLSVTAFYGFRTRRWMLGAVAGALATATRANGVFMVPALALVAWREARGGDRRTLLLASVAVAFTLAGVGSYSLYVYSVSGHPFEWANTMARWNWQPGSTAGWQPLAQLVVALATRPYEHLTGSPQRVFDLMNAAAGIALLVATPFIWRRFGIAYALLILVNLYVPLSSGALEGVGRYAAVLFPFPLWLATIESRTIRAGLLATFGMFYGIGLAMFTKVYPLY